MSHCEEMMMVAESLQTWVDRTHTGDDRLYVELSMTPDSSDAISIGGVVVYCSENTPNGMSFEACRAEFLKHVHSLFGFWHEALELSNQTQTESVGSTDVEF